MTLNTTTAQVANPFQYGTTASRRLVYVNKFAEMLANPTKQLEFLQWFQYNKLNAIATYDMRTALASPSSKAAYRSFVTRAREQYGAVWVDAVAGSAARGAAIATYNSETRNPLGKVTGIMYEHEPWYISNDDIASGITTLSQKWSLDVTDMQTLRVTARNAHLIFRRHWGWFKIPGVAPSTQADVIVANVDETMIASYVAESVATQSNGLLTWFDGAEQKRLSTFNDAARRAGVVHRVFYLMSLEMKAWGGESDFLGLYGSKGNTTQEIYNQFFAQYAKVAAQYPNLLIDSYAVFASSYGMISLPGAPTATA